MPELPLDYDWLIAKDRKYACEYINYFAKKTAKLALHMIENHEWNIFNVTFTSTDRLQHFYWHDRHLLREHYVWLDSVIGTLLNYASNEEADIIILSDHGFGPLYKNVYVNSILAAEGLIQTRNSIVRLAMNTAGLRSRVPTSLLRQMKLHDRVLKLIPKRLRQMFPSAKSRSICSRSTAKLSSAAGIFIEKDLCDDYEATRDLITHKLLSLKDGDKNVFAGAYRPKEALWGPFTSRAPDLLIIPNEGYHPSTSIENEIFGAPVQPNSGVRRTGDHRMEGIFIANGPNIKKGHKLNSKVNTWDVTPTILHLFGAPIPSYIDGTVIRSIFRNGCVSTTTRTAPK